MWVGNRSIRGLLTHIALLYGRFAGWIKQFAGRPGAVLAFAYPPVLKMQRLKDGVSHA